jgi:hypothetical protein
MTRIRLRYRTWKPHAAMQPWGVFIGRPRSRSRTCERGQFAAMARAPRGMTLLPIARWLAPFTDRIVLALELADLRAAEVTLALKVIGVG